MALILRADSRALPFRDRSVHCVVTSPAYFGQRFYGADGREIGRGSLRQYLVDVRDSAREVWRVLADDGLLWLNLGDTQAGSGGAGGDYNPGGSKEGRPRYRQGETGLGTGQACLVPQKVAVVLQQDGWLVRRWITWDKQRCRREDVEHVRRPLSSSEVILMLAKSMRYRYFPRRAVESGDVWHFPPSGERNRGQAPFPEELPRRCIALSTEPGDVVLDPASGSGTTLRAAARMGRVGVGADLYMGRSIPIDGSRRRG